MNQSKQLKFKKKQRNVTDEQVGDEAIAVYQDGNESAVLLIVKVNTFTHEEEVVQRYVIYRNEAYGTMPYGAGEYETVEEAMQVVSNQLTNYSEFEL